jgi:hypothetical protein
MSTKYPGQKWKVDAVTADEIKSYLIQQGGVEDKDIKSEHEVWRVKFSDATLIISLAHSFAQHPQILPSKGFGSLFLLVPRVGSFPLARIFSQDLMRQERERF